MKPTTMKTAKDAAIARLQDMVASLRAENAEMEKRLDTAQGERIATSLELQALQKKIHDGKVWNVENPRLTPRAQAALNLAKKEATESGATYVGTEHLLLGMLKQQEGIAARHFIACGMSYDKVSYALRVGRVS